MTDREMDKATNWWLNSPMSENYFNKLRPMRPMTLAERINEKMPEGLKIIIPTKLYN